MDETPFLRRYPPPSVIEELSNPKILFYRKRARYHWSFHAGNGYLIAQSNPLGYTKKALMIQRCAETLAIEEFADVSTNHTIAIRHEGREYIDVEDQTNE